MKPLTILIAATLVTTIAYADTPAADYVEGERSADLITPEITASAEVLLGRETASNLLHAMRLNMSLYDADMRSKQGRTRWHGRCIHEIVDTNALCAVEVYSNAVDGATWRYRKPWKIKRPQSVASRISSERHRQQAAAAAERRRLDRIAAITTNETTEVAALMRKNGYPEDLARLMLKWELSKLLPTNTVNAVITPQK